MSIDYKNELNAAQLEAVQHTDGPVLVIAGAGSGKTRTIVYRLAHLVEHGIDPAQILLLTFTRKAAQEMLHRTETILGRPLLGTSGGTFHSFAYATLRMNTHDIGFPNGFTLLDRGDSEAIVRDVRTDLQLGKGDKSYPKKNTLLDMITKSRNKERPIDAIVEQEAYHLASYVEDFETISKGYDQFKNEHALVDYDDLLFRLDQLLTENEPLRNQLQTRYRYIMVDEYQDTNRVQARIVKHLAGSSGNVMAVGDDAQSIYAFRGANIANILNFPKIFEGAKLIRLEQNYRSVQPILTMTNHILQNAHTKFEKKLFSERQSSKLPEVIYPISDQTQARLVTDKVIELAKKYDLHEIAVLFRAGYQSYHLEVALTRIGIQYQKYGGIRFHEAAHVKDILCLLRLVLNTHDLVAWQRSLEHVKGVGPKTVKKIYDAIHTEGKEKYLRTMRKKHQDLDDLLNELDAVRRAKIKAAAIMDRIMSFYTPILTAKYPDDYPKRQAGLEQLGQIAANYSDLESFLGDLSLDGDPEEEKRKENALVLSTVHSSKGLEWKAVIILDCVEERFPSKKAMNKPEDLEEERRLMYVACTRAMDSLHLFVPRTIYNRFTYVSEPALPSPFVLELPESTFQSLRESYSGNMEQTKTKNETKKRKTDTQSVSKKCQLGFCQHKIFGRGKIIARVEPNKYRINFPGFGLKVIIEDYVELLSEN